MVRTDSATTLGASHALEHRLGLVGHVLRLGQERLTLEITTNSGKTSRSADGSLRLVLHLDLVRLNLLVDLAEKLLGQVLSVVDAPVVLHEVLLGHALRLEVLVMLISVQHDNRERQDVRSVGVGKDRIGVLVQVSLGKLEHESVDLLRLTRKTERLQVRPESVGETRRSEVLHVDEGVHGSNVLLLALTEVLSDDRLAETIVGEQEVRDVVRGVAGNETVLNKELDTALGAEVELLDTVLQHRLSHLLAFKLVDVVVSDRNVRGDALRWVPRH